MNVELPGLPPIIDPIQTVLTGDHKKSRLVSTSLDVLADGSGSNATVYVHPSDFVTPVVESGLDTEHEQLPGFRDLGRVSLSDTDHPFLD